MSKIKISSDLRQLVRSNNYKPNDQQFAELNAVFYLVTKLGTGKGRSIPGRCPSGACLFDSYKIIRNYMDFHEVRTPSTEPKQTNVKVYNFPKQEPKSDGLDNLSLKDLRELYPEIKDTSKKGFIKQVRKLK